MGAEFNITFFCVLNNDSRLGMTFKYLKDFVWILPNKVSVFNFIINSLIILKLILLSNIYNGFILFVLKWIHFFRTFSNFKIEGQLRCFLKKNRYWLHMRLLDCPKVTRKFFLMSMPLLLKESNSWNFQTYWRNPRNCFAERTIYLMNASYSEQLTSAQSRSNLRIQHAFISLKIVIYLFQSFLLWLFQYTFVFSLWSYEKMDFFYF